MRASRALISVVLAVALTTPALGYEGYGSYTHVGDTVYTVTHLGDSGFGSLRDAVSQCCRTVRFAVSGTIYPVSEIRVLAPYILIDGLSAPYDPACDCQGVRLYSRGLILRGNEGAHNIIVRGIRIHNALNDGIQIANGTWNIVVDHVSVHGSLDGAIDVTESAHDVTISNSFLTGDKIMLIKYGYPRRISFFGNLVDGNQRAPQVRMNDGTRDVTDDVNADVRNNFIVARGNPGDATLGWFGVKLNVINNFYVTPRDVASIRVQQAWGYLSGNVQYVGTGDPNTATFQENRSNGTWPTASLSAPLPVVPVTTLSACNAAGVAWVSAGAQPRDYLDNYALYQIGNYIGTLPPGQGCP
jgi:hypothetical protein